ncbi:piggyBac transposable element-derived protein 4-like [Vespula squamosa]|uniref:PiggyBac transposable element-derived protein 4-like n=1 Tax=Vespula squamosa TaxID=30214 RepID=A0ABD2BS72_VESSQ
MDSGQLSLIIHGAIVNETNESSDQDNDEVREEVRSRKIRIIDSETDRETAEDSSQWFLQRIIMRRKKLKGKTLSSNLIWRYWRDVAKEEFWAFIPVIINISTMQLANLQEYWSRNQISYIPFYSKTFTKNRFSQIFWIVYTLTDSNTGHICGILAYYGSLTIEQLVRPDLPVPMRI